MFKTQVGYDSNAGLDVGDQVMEGLKLIPKALVAALEGKVAHGGFELSVKLVDSGGAPWSSDLSFDTNTFIYMSNTQLDTTGRLGSVTLEFTLLANVYPIGEIRLTVMDTKKVGYAVNVETQMVLNGDTLATDSAVAAGTKFDFAVALSTAAKRDFYSGDFVLTMGVTDASGVVQHTQDINGADNAAPIALEYTLSGIDFPAGAVSFVFTVSNSAGAHTVHTVTAMLAAGMVAEAIVLVPTEAGSSKYMMGETIEVTMSPTVAGTPFTTANAASRMFVMDVVSSSGTVVSSVEGKAVEGRATATYMFTMQVPSTLEQKR